MGFSYSRRVYVNKKYVGDIEIGSKLKLRYLKILVAETALLATLFLGNSFLPQLVYSSTKTASPLSYQGDVAGTSVVVQNEPTSAFSTPTVAPTETPVPSPTAIPTPTIIKLPKDSYTIAVFGDSMVDTMGERLEYLEHSLKRKYPATNFNLYNYGKGAQHVEDGLARFYSQFDYQDRHYPPISQIKPDIIILGSFAYNPFFPYDRNRHWLGLARLIDEARTLTPNVYLLDEIRPLRSDFGHGPNGVNWDESTSLEHSGRIIEQLENAIGLSKSKDVSLIDAFNPSLGDKKYVNPSDGIHPSVAGHEFTADLIASTIKLL